MRVTISFPILGNHRMDATWPVQLDDRLFGIKTVNGCARRVLVTFPGVDISYAPTITDDPTKRVRTAISAKGDLTVRAERDVRAWQALLAPYAVLPIDFDDAEVEYRPESVDEEGSIPVSSFRAHRTPRRLRGQEDFSVFGRAFLAVETAYGQIEQMAFYIEGARALDAQRPIDAYNSFYLWFESNYCLPFKTKDAVPALLSKREYVDALVQAAADPEVRPKSSETPLKAALLQPLDVRQLTRQLVELRGFLRHHSLSNPARWDPANQDRFTEEAQFLANVAFQVAFPHTIGRTWSEPYVSEFFRQAEELGCVTEIHAILTIREDDRLLEVGLDLRFPSTSANAALAKATMEKVLEAVDLRSPGAELFGVRARVQPHGPELLRYDLGPALPR